MARVELPQSRVSIRRRARRTRTALVLGLLLLLVLVGLIATTNLSAVRITTVEVTGAQTLSSSTLQAQVRELLQGSYFWVVPRDSIFFYPKAAIMRELLDTYPTLALAQAHAVDFHTIALVLRERQPRAQWCTNYGCYFMDENGVVYAQAPQFSTAVYVQYFGTTTALALRELPRQYLVASDFSSLSALVDAVVQKLATSTGELQGVQVDENSDVAMHYKSGFALHFALHEQAGDVFERLSLTIESGPLAGKKLSDLEYLDLRFGEKVYYKFKVKP